MCTAIGFPVLRLIRCGGIWTSMAWGRATPGCCNADVTLRMQRSPPCDTMNPFRGIAPPQVMDLTHSTPPGSKR